MTTLTLVLFILLLPLCLFLIGLILLQGGAGDISSAFGGGGQLDSTLGVGAGRKMSKITGWLSAVFMAIVLLLSIQHAGDFTKAAGPSTKPAALPVGTDGQNTPATQTGTTPPANVAPQVPVVAPVDGTAPAVAPAAAPTAPAVTPAPANTPVEQPAAPAPATEKTAVQPVAPAPQPAAAATPAEQPAAAPAAQPAAPRSGITLDEPAQ